MTDRQLLRAVAEAVIRLGDHIRSLEWDNRHILVIGDVRAKELCAEIGRMQVELSNALMQLAPDD